MDKLIDEALDREAEAYRTRFVLPDWFICPNGNDQQSRNEYASELYEYHECILLYEGKIRQGWVDPRLVTKFIPAETAEASTQTEPDDPTIVQSSSSKSAAPPDPKI